jgi:hypothetical protein
LSKFDAMPVLPVAAGESARFWSALGAWTRHLSQSRAARLRHLFQRGRPRAALQEGRGVVAPFLQKRLTQYLQQSMETT